MLLTFSGRKASQNEWELREFCAYLLLEGVASYLEIGARHGDTFHEVMLSMPFGAKGVALDLPGVAWGTATSRQHLQAATQDLRSRGYDANCIFGDSKTPATQILARQHGPYDAILIDGDHTYAGVAADWRNFRSAGRLIAFHDIVGDGQIDKARGLPVEVPRLWSEIKASGLATVEFVAPGSTMGIGVVCASQ